MPNILTPEPENIPQFLKDHPHWVVWKRTRRGEKWTKPPFNPKTGKAAKVNDPATWADFETALFVHQKSDKFDGIGFMLTDALGLVGFDFDHCIDEAGGVDARVLEWVETLDTYAETSPSGDGLRVLAFGELPEGKRKAGPFEVYDAGRYLTITGHRLGGSSSSDKLEHRREGVRKVYDAIFGDGAGKKPKERSEDPRNVVDEPDQDRLDQAFSSKHGDTIRALYGGQWQGLGYPTQSEADLALCRHLAFWFGKSEANIDRVFRASGLMRGKWDTPVKRGGETYGAATIRKAVDSTAAVYKGGPLVEGDPGKAAGGGGDPQREMDKWMDRLNREHAVIMLGGKCCVMNEFVDPVTERPDIDFSSVQDFKNRYANQPLFNPKSGKVCSAAEIWFRSKKRRQYDGVVFAPGADVGGFYNLWRGFTVKPKPGEWDLFRRHIWENVVGENETYFKWLLAWFARIVQDPGGERPGTAVVLQGKKGTGKGTLVNPFAEILGHHFLHISHQRHITGNFNGHLKNALLVFADEAVWGGNKSDEGALKHLITEPYLFLEHKGKDAFPIRSNVNLLLASNEKWCVPAGMAERRFFVLEMKDTHIQDKEYFGAVWNQLRNGGLEAMLHDLLTLDIGGIDLRTAPKTPALLKQVEHGMTPFEQWWYERLMEAENDPETGEWETQVETDKVYGDYLDFSSKIGARGYRLSKHQFGRRLKELCSDIVRNRASTANHLGKRPRVYQFPPLRDCRNAFVDQMKIEILWDDGF